MNISFWSKSKNKRHILIFSVLEVIFPKLSLITNNNRIRKKAYIVRAYLAQEDVLPLKNKDKKPFSSTSSKLVSADRLSLIVY